MYRLVAHFLIVVLVCLSSCSEYSYVKSALKSQQKGKLDKTEVLVLKAQKKDSLLPAVFYAKAALLFDSGYHQFNIDKAYHQIKQSRMFFASLEEKEMKKHINVGIDLLAIDRLRKRIEHAGFIRAEMNSSEASYNEFLDEFGDTQYDEEAILRRDSVAFNTASEINTYQAYEDFMNKYPGAIQIPDAKKKYEKLYFLKSTSDGKLASYIKFLKVHPDTPYRSEAEKEIFEISTAGNSESSYQKFINAYPKSIYAAKAKRILFHLAPAGFKWKSDSINNALILMEKGELIPINKEKKYGFSDVKGEEVVPPIYDNLKPGYLCHTLKNDFFETGREIIALDQSVIFSGLYESTEDLGSGILKITTPSGVFVMHKSGWPVTSLKFNDVKRINSFIAVSIHGKWGIITFGGRQIVEPKFDEIFVVGNFYFFKIGELFDVVSHEQLTNSADNQPLNIQPLYDDYELLNDELVWVSSEVGEAVLNRNLVEVIPYSNHNINFLTSGYLIKKKDKITVLNSDFNNVLQLNSESVKSNDSYLTVKDKAATNLYSLEGIKNVKEYDSTALLGRNFAVGYSKDSTFIHFKNEQMLYFSGNRDIEYLTNSNSASYVSVQSKRRNISYYDINGALVLEGNFDSVTPLGNEYLVVTDRGKKGLFSINNGQLLAPKFDAIANYNQGYVSFLGNRKFGIVHDSLGVKVINNYDKNLIPYNKNLLIAEKSGSLGLVDKAGQIVSSFSFDEIQFWTDSVALVKEGSNWQFYNIYSKEREEMIIKSFQVINDSNAEKLIIALTDTGYGVFSNIYGEVISPTFNDIVNLGSAEEPLYFTEKHVSEAEFYVVIYYTKEGELIQKLVFEAKDYPLIYCEE
ncbi:WG repeat-containing protein [Fulvivirga lutea]|uniref:WG repeat-containing protein n=1 Tax=Fulvivirga lutea TaxID=2810512 RepID=A0A975A2R7_9BACT|nr:WG repeat-containing protein [Fulvivirga lutea]QSE98832.1 WG repeat-containing protein [Fulvivirga lutea]